jgi:phage shock protein A
MLLTCLEIGAGVALFLVVVTGNGGKLLSLAGSMIGLGIGNAAKNPKAAEAIYDKQIEKAKDNYKIINDSYKKFTGIVKMAENNLKKAQAEYERLDKECRRLVEDGDEENAMLLADEVCLLKEQMDAYQEQIRIYTPKMEEAEELNTEIQNRINQLKQEKKMSIQKLKMNLEVQKVYDSMDKLKDIDGTDKLMSKVKESMEEAEEQAIGSKVIYENSRDFKLNRIKNNMRVQDRKAYIESLKGNSNSEQIEGTTDV